MTEDERKNHCYLGDAVYLEKVPGAFILRTGDHRSSECTNEIILDLDVLDKFLDYINFYSQNKETISE